MRSKTNNISNYLKLIRPYQWLKNILLFCPVFFSGDLRKEQLISSSMAVVCFCLISSIGYILNDWVDRKRDAYHPEKMHRPLSAGLLSGSQALILSGILTLSIIFFFAIASFPIKFYLIITCYFILTTSYSLHLKNIVLLELFVVSFGFVLRVLAGGSACSIVVSNWLFMTVFFISMLISSAKRLSEYMVLGEKIAVLHRISQNTYTITYLTNMLWVCGGITLVVYALYVVERGGVLIYSILPATYGIFRFIYLAGFGKVGDPVQTLFTDNQLLIITSFFLTFIGITIYYPI